MSRWHSIGTAFQGKKGFGPFDEFIQFTRITSLISFGFYNTSLTRITLPANIGSIENAAFQLARSLTTIKILKADGVVTLGNKAFDLATSLAHIYVPSNLVDEYKAASGWSDYASKIAAIP